jgi:putative hydrolase of the HAD superfamily
LSGRPFDALLLDFGGVCLLTPFELHHVTERSLGLPAGTFTWRGPFDPASDALYVASTKGVELTEREYWRRRALDVGRAIGREDYSIREYFDHCYDGTAEELLRASIVQLAADARAAGMRTGVLTNDLQAFHGRAFKDRFEAFFGPQDAYVDASISGVLKPDPRAYEAALTQLGLPAERVLFVDDQPGNVAGSEAVGMPAVFFDLTDLDGTMAAVRARLGLTRGR